MPLLTHRVPGLRAVSELRRLRELHRPRGERAFLAGDRHELDRLQEEIRSRPPDVPRILERAGSLDVAQWISDRRREMEEDGHEFDEDLVGAWTGEIPNKGSLSLHLNPATQDTMREVYIAVAPVPEAWQIPAVVGYGGWNECPDSVVQCAFARKWAAKYDEEIVGLSFDTIEWEVRKPPGTKDEAMALAWEQFYLCEDIVTQGVGTIHALGATLLESPYWFFWWD